MSYHRDKEDEQPGIPMLESSNGESKSTSRRRFTRNALTGGAVLFSLGNRPAWSQQTDTVCVETDTLVSAVAPLASASPLLTLEEENNMQTILESDPEQVYQTGTETCVDTKKTQQSLSYCGFLDNGPLDKSVRQQDMLLGNGCNKG